LTNPEKLCRSDISIDSLYLKQPGRLLGF